MAHTLPLDGNDVVLAESKVKRNGTEVNADCRVAQTDSLRSAALCELKITR